MPFTKYFTKNNAQGIVISDTSSAITFEAGHSFPTDVSSGPYLITLNPPSGEIVRVTAASQDVSGVLTVTVTREQEDSNYLDHSSGTLGYMLFTAGQFNNFSENVDLNTTKLGLLDVTSSLNLNTMYNNIQTNNAKISFDSTSSTKLAGIEAGAQVNTVTGVNGKTGNLTLVTGDISDTTSTQKFATAAEKTKLGYISVTQAVDLDTMESNIATNNAKITNADHSGDVTGSSALTIVPAAISGKTGVTPVSGDYVLLWDATDSALKKADASNFLAGAVTSVNSKVGIVTLVTGDISDTTSTQKYATAAEKTKLGYISVTQAVDLDTLESNTTTNNAKVTNADHSGDVTGSAALAIVPAAISGKTSVTAVSGDYVLLWDATDSALKKANVADFIGGGAVDSVNGKTGVVTLVTGDISDTTSTQKFATAAQLAKVDYLSVTQAVDLDTMESNITTNNAKVTNADHSGDVTGATALAIVPAAISGKTSVTAVSGDYVLLWDATDSALKKANVSDFIGGGAVDSVNGKTGVVTLVTGDISDTTSTQKFVTATDITKLGHISVTQAVDLDTMESNIATNNAKVTNASHSGDVTGADVLGIVPAAISGKTGVTPAAGDYVLLWDATDSLLKKSLVDTFINGASGDVTGPASSTDNGIAIYNGTAGKTIKNSLVTIDTSSVNIPGFLTVTGQARHATQTALTTSGTVAWNINNNPKANLILAGDVTSLTISGINLNSESTLYLKQHASTPYTVAWPAGIIWAGDTAPDLSTLSSNHMVSFFSYDGTGLYGSHVSDDIVAGSGAVDSVNSKTGTVVLVTGDISDTTSTQKYATAAQLAKVDYLTVTQAVDLDTIESNTTTNNAKVTNANHSGDVTGADVLGIVPAAISGKTSVTAVSGDYVLLWDATDSALKKANVSDFIGGGAVDSVNGKTGVVTLVTGDISDTTSTQKFATAAQLAKVDYLTVTQAVDLDTMESNIATNNAKVTNADHSGDVTGATALAIVPAAISGKTGVTPVAGDYVLLWDATDSALKKADVTAFISAGGGGDVTGPASSTNTGIAIYNGTGGKTLMNSLVTVDTSSVAIPGFLTVTGQARHANQTALSTSATVAWNVNNDPKANIVLTNDVTSLTISGININSEAVLYLKQDATVAKTITWPGTIIWAGGSQPNLSTLNSKHVIAFYSYDGTGLIGSHISDDSVSIVSSVNGSTGAVTLVTANISDTTSTQKYTTAANLTKLGFISVTQAVDLDTMESNITTNNAKVTNADHSGDVTGAAALAIVPAAISGKTGVTPVSGDYVLLWDATDSALKKADVTSFLNGGVTSVNSKTGAVTLVTGDISDTTSTQKFTTAANLTKLGFISVTQAVDLDTMESNIATNNAKVTNASHTGDVTGADVLGIVPAAISGKTGVTPVAGDYVLLWDATDSLLKKADVTSFVNGTYGDVTGPASSTNTGVAIFNGTGGKTLMNSLVTIDTSSATIPGFLSVTGQARNTAQTALTTSGTVAWNINNDPKANIILAGDVTSLTVSGININSNGVLYVKQHASAAKTITWPATIKWSGNTTPDISNLSSINVFSFFSYDGTNLMGTHITDQTTTFTPNANHTGDVTGSAALSIVPAAISGKTGVTAVAGDYVLLWDATDSALKKADVTDFISPITATSTTTFTNKRITKRVTTLTDAATIAINSDNMDVGKVTLTASRTLGTPTGTPTDYQSLLVEVVQGGTGSYTLTADSTSTAGSYRFGSDVTGFTLSTAVGKKDLILLTYLSDITGWAVASISKGYPA